MLQVRRGSSALAVPCATPVPAAGRVLGLSATFPPPHIVTEGRAPRPV